MCFYVLFLGLVEASGKQTPNPHHAGNKVQDYSASAYTPINNTQ